MKGLTFSEPMVKAWLNGTKTVTRRLMKPQPSEGAYPHHEEKDGFAFANPCSFHKPRYLPGETVYIKETWATPIDDPNTTEIGLVSYLASEQLLAGHWKIKSPRFMPEWASRSHALIVSVRPEMVQEITPEEIKKEGLVVQDFAGIGIMFLLGLTPETYMESVALQEFKALWESLHPGSWDRNDWVWRIELKKV